MTERVLETTDRDGLTLTTDLRPAHTTGDARLVERLAVNLVGNAVRHNVSKGWVSVRTSTTNGQARLVVENTGPAVPEGEMDRLFEPFQRRERTGDGIGLGLSIVRAIAVAHDADLSAEPLARGGLRVAVSFPSR